LANIFLYTYIWYDRQDEDREEDEKPVSLLSCSPKAITGRAEAKKI